MTIADFRIGDRFSIDQKGHLGCIYEVTGFWSGAKNEWMDIRDLNDTPLALTGFCDVNIRAFAERNAIKREDKPNA